MQAASLEEALVWTRQAHQLIHDASRELADAQKSGQMTCAEAAKRRLVETVRAATEALAHL